LAFASIARVAAGAWEKSGAAGRVSRATAAVLYAAIASASAVQRSAALGRTDRTEERRAVSGWNITFTLLIIESKIVADRRRHQ